MTGGPFAVASDVPDLARRVVLRFAAAASLAGVSPGEVSAQPRSRATLGFLLVGDQTTNRAWLVEFEAALARLGWTVGRNVRIEYRFGDGDPRRLSVGARELVALGPDILVTVGITGAAALKALTITIPIVGINLADPIGAGLVGSLARPGGNVTGVAANIGTGILGKRLQMLRAFVPAARRVAVLRVPGEYTPRFWQDLAVAATALGVELVPFDAADDSFPAAFAAIGSAKPDALFLLGGGVLIRHLQPICDFTLRARLPATYAFRRFVQSGLLFSYGVEAAEAYRRSAVYVDRILRGAPAGELPIEQSNHYELTINRRTAQLLGVRIPPELILQADEVFG